MRGKQGRLNQDQSAKTVRTLDCCKQRGDSANTVTNANYCLISESVKRRQQIITKLLPRSERLWRRGGIAPQWARMERDNMIILKQRFQRSSVYLRRETVGISQINQRLAQRIFGVEVVELGRCVRHRVM